MEETTIFLQVILIIENTKSKVMQVIPKNSKTIWNDHVFLLQIKYKAIQQIY